MRMFFIALYFSILVLNFHGSKAFSSRCYLVDLEMFYNTTTATGEDGAALNINLTEFSENFRGTNLERLLTTKWFGDWSICDGVQVYWNIAQRKSEEDGVIVLAVIFSYQPKDHVRTNQSDVLACVDHINVKYKEHKKEYNFISAAPKLQNDDGQKVEAYNMSFPEDLRFCCQDNDTCCPSGSSFVHVNLSNYDCECQPGYYYEPPTSSKCYPCPRGTYQPEPGTKACRSCPEGMTTVDEAATSCISSSAFTADCESRVDWSVEGVFSWKKTRRGSHMTLACPYGPLGVNVERQCVFNPGTGVRWGELDRSVCTPSARTLFLLGLSQEVVTSSNAMNVSERLALGSRNATELNAYDIALITMSLEAIIRVEDRLVEVSDNIMEVLNNVLLAKDATLMDSQEHNRTTTKLLEIIEKFSENIPLTNGRQRSLMKENIAIDLQLPTTQMAHGGVSIKIEDDADSLAGTTMGSAKPYVTISSQVFNRHSPSERLISVIYQNAKLFPIIREEDDRGEVPNPGTKSRVGGVVIAVRLKNIVVKDVLGAVELNFASKEENNKRQAPVCVYWNFTDGFGNWSTDGCSLVAMSTTRGSDYVTCRCSHMTNFAMLLTADPESYELDGYNRDVLGVISYIGCAISLLGALLTLVTYTMFHINARTSAKVINKEGEIVAIKYLRRSNAQLILCHLCVALIGLLTSFLVVASASLKPSSISCRAVAILVHYFMLTTFSWMAVEGLNMYLAFVKVMSANIPRFMTKAIAIAWGLPILIVIITASAAFGHYSSDNSCFLHGVPFYLSMFLPAIAVLVSNFVIFGLTMYSLSQMGKNVNSKENRFRGYKRVKVALSILVLLGFTWLFGVMAIGDVRLVFQYLFCIFNSLQGFAIFWFHCVRQAEVRQCWFDFLFRNGSRRRKYTTGSTLPALNNKKSTFGASPDISTNHRSVIETCDRQQSNAAELNFNQLTA